jgi:hypothetical protein
MLLDIAEETVQLEASERLPEGVDPDTLRKYFTLTTEDLEQGEQCRGATNKLESVKKSGGRTLATINHLKGTAADLPQPAISGPPTS